MDYIDREELLADLRLARALTPGLPYEGSMAKIVDVFFDLIAQYPATDVAPVKRGAWEDFKEEGTWACSRCGEPFTLMEGTPQENFYNFCPNCGAPMR